jgi:hypothetical protein
MQRMQHHVHPGAEGCQVLLQRLQAEGVPWSAEGGSMTHHLAILDRLDNVRSTGKDRGICSCPAHKDKSRSMSWRDAGDRLLLHCFAGCSIYDITAALQINLRDLFADQRTDRTRLHDDQRLPLRDALLMLRREAWLVLVAGGDMLNGKTLSEADVERLGEAVCRIQSMVGATRIGA